MVEGVQQRLPTPPSINVRSQIRGGIPHLVAFNQLQETWLYLHIHDMDQHSPRTPFNFVLDLGPNRRLHLGYGWSTVLVVG
jgi:hypothetical protein